MLNIHQDAAVNALLTQCVETAQEIFGSQLLSCYVIGSLAHGGFSALSDIDVAIILTGADDLNTHTKVVAIQAALQAKELPYTNKLSIFWGHLTQLNQDVITGRFPLADRMDLKTSGKLLYGEDIKQQLIAPTAHALLTDTIKNALDLLHTKKILMYIQNISQFLLQDLVFITKSILFPVRLMYTARHAAIGLHSDAIQDYLCRTQGLKSTLVQTAYAWRQIPPPDITVYEALIANTLPAIYSEFLLLYESNMQDYNQYTLVQQLQTMRLSLERSMVAL